MVNKTIENLAEKLAWFDTHEAVNPGEMQEILSLILEILRDLSQLGENSE